MIPERSAALAAVALCAVALVPVPPGAGAREAVRDLSAGARCDRLAAFDGEAGTVPVPLAEIDAEGAIAACEEALDAPGAPPRYRVQLARGFLKAGRFREAARTLEHAVAEGDPAAMFVLAQMHHSGRGIGRDLVRARELYAQALDAGYERAAVGLVILKERAGPPVHDPDGAEALRRVHGLEGRELPRLP
jgi:TPR repeat protein